MEIIAMRGLPSNRMAGLARGWVLDDFYHRVRVSRYDIQNMLFGGYTGLDGDEEMAGRLIIQAIGQAFSHNRDIIVDDTNINPVHLGLIQKTAEQLSNFRHIKFSVWDVPVNINDSLDYDSSRNVQYGHSVLFNMEQALVDTEDWKPELGVRLVEYEF